ncbi:hypothetical protein HMPREF1147_1988 [Selenomonas sp. FOBRC9]|nr:hypothetical protein HMPREF1147_1988 [Selenomonas sp. FOBRC9]
MEPFASRRACGVWIETTSSAPTCAMHSSRRACGVWIETAEPERLEEPEQVAPRMRRVD